MNIEGLKSGIKDLPGRFFDETFMRLINVGGTFMNYHFNERDSSGWRDSIVIKMAENGRVPGIGLSLILMGVPSEERDAIRIEMGLARGIHETRKGQLDWSRFRRNFTIFDSLSTV